MFIAFGYAITAPALLLLGVFSGTINQYVRLSEVGLLLVIMCLSFLNMRMNNSVLLPLFIFFLIYSVRLLDDVLFEGILMIYQTPVYVLGYFFGLTLLPVISIAVLYRPGDSQTFFRYSLIFLVAANVVLFMYAITHGDFALVGAFSGRVQEVGELEDTSVLSPLWLGTAGALLASMLFGIYGANRRLSRVAQIVCVALLGLCAANILFSASRGPIAALVLTVMFFLLRPTVTKSRVRGFVSRWKGWIAALGIIGVYAVLIASSEGDVFLVERFWLMYADRIAGVVEARDIIFSAAWQDFLSSPLLGTSYVVSYANSSPHNIVLESLMATGLVGSFFLFLALYRSFMGIQRLMGGMRGVEGVSLALATVCALVIGLTSSPIGQTPLLWILVALVTVMGVPDVPRIGEER
jgi:hypothetical protein